MKYILFFLSLLPFFGYSSSFNSATRVITFTLNGTLTASTVYEFNILFNGKN